MEAPPIHAARPLGTMVAYGFAQGSVRTDLDIARTIGATCLEILPDWASFPDPVEMRRLASDGGFSIHSAHGCWGGRSIQADRVDLGATDQTTWRASVDDLLRCLDWLSDAGGRCLVVHPGGYSAEEEAEARRDSLIRGLNLLADHAGKSGPVVCVENMPPDVFPGTQMSDLATLVADIDRPEVGVAIDTGHANIVASAHAETLAAGRWLRTTHVHDNDGRKDSHAPPGSGTIDWNAWAEALDRIEYDGPIMLECIRHLRRDLDAFDADILQIIRGGRPRR